ncbi:collagen alpha-1(XII) chain [Elysia marginata]|uniref:Collagen alpha-1(XII) chain n=1 Tax=Elysia marginata TaxID=1093978 RepID=A0AAV4FHQ2_9GAST|nr:collagen alpha-1(XII) chain [Elysia marginata]
MPTLDARFARRQAEECLDQCKDVPMEISFIVDSSRSIAEKDFTAALWFVQNFVENFQIGEDKVRVSMVTYGHRVYSEYAFGFNAHLDKFELEKAITNIPHMNGKTTETGQAIDWFLANQYPEARNVRRVLIVLTDGNSQVTRLTKAAAKRAFDKGMEVFAIGVGRNIDPVELHNIASEDRHVFLVSSYTTLGDITSRLKHETCGATSLALHISTLTPLGSKHTASNVSLVGARRRRKIQTTLHGTICEHLQ